MPSGSWCGHGADVNAAEPRGGQTALMWAAAEGHDDVVAGLVEMGANVNAASRTGFTPLVFAAIKDDVASIRTLLEGRRRSERRAASRAPNRSSSRMQYKHTAAALALLEGGADLNVRDRAGNTTLHLAAQAGDLNLVRALLGEARRSERAHAEVDGAGRRPAAAVDSAAPRRASRRR